MKNETRFDIIEEMKLARLEHHQDIKKQLSKKLNFENLNYGSLVIRDSKNWRINEKFIEQVWMLYISTSFMGEACIFWIEFKENKFRDIINTKILTEGIFLIEDNKIVDLHVEQNQISNEYIDRLNIPNIIQISNNQNFTANHRNFKLFVNNNTLDCYISFSDLNNPSWVKWYENVYNQVLRLSFNSKNEELITFFKHI